MWASVLQPFDARTAAANLKATEHAGSHMRRFLSISVLLQTVTLLMTLSLVTVCGLYALEALHKQEAARRVPQILEVSNHLYAALQSIRNERGNTLTLIESSQLTTPEIKAELGTLRAASGKALNSMLMGLASIEFEGRDEALAEIRAPWRAFDGLRHEVDTALQEPLERRPTDLGTRWVDTYNALSDTIDGLSNRLENELTHTDAYTAGLVRIKQIAWSVRAETGRDRFRLGTIMTSGKGLTESQRLTFAVLAGQIDGEWKILKDQATVPDMPPELRAAVVRADKLYFTDVRKAHNEIVANLAAGRTTGIDTHKWMLLATPGQEAIFAVGKVALDSAGEHALEQFTTAQRDFYIAILLMGFFCAIGVLTSWYVFRGVVRPVNRVTEAMRSIAEGNLAHTIPYEHRSDEIGSLAHGLRVFRDNAIEKQRLRIEKDGAVAASRAKSEFLANVSHELRTPLNAIIGFSDVIKTEMFGPVGDRYRAYSMDIFNSGTHLLGLINEIVDLSKLEAGQLELHEEVVDMAGCVDACVNLIKDAATKAGVHLSVYLDFDVSFVLADERRLRQILINLLSNAVKFTPDSGRVRLSTTRVPEGFTIQVSDTGIGIAAEDIPKALTPFGQVDSKISRKHEGTGLGLPLVKHLAELHGGSLSIASEPNIGTTVTVFFPTMRIVRVAQSLRA